MSHSVSTMSFVKTTDPVESEVGPHDSVFSRQRLAVFFFVIAIFAAAARPITDPDFWWHLKTGQYIVETKAIPTRDIFSTLKYGKEWVTHEWLSESLMYGVFRIAGYGGLIVFFALVITIAFWTMYRRCVERTGQPYIAGLVMILCATATVPAWGVRPQMFSILFAAVFLVILDAYCSDQKTRKVWWLIPLMIIWVNMHAGFAVGLALIAVTIVGLAIDERVINKAPLNSIWERIRKLCLVGLQTCAAVLINPSGWRIYSYPFETLRSKAQMQYIQEWRPPNFQDPMFLGLLLLILVIILVLSLSNKRPRPSEILIMLATLGATLRSARNVPFFALVAAPTLASSLWFWYSNYQSNKAKSSPSARQIQTGSRAALNVAIFVILPALAALISVQQTIARQRPVEAENFPVTAVNFLKSHNLSQPIFNEYHWGGYLIWNLYPQYRVFIDGRADVYGDALMEQYFVIHDGETRWRLMADYFNIQTVLVEPNTPIASLLREDSTWQNVFEDEHAVIFSRH